MYLWRAVDDEGEVLDVVVQKRRDTEAALRLLRRLLRNQLVEPEAITTDGLRSYGAALKELGLEDLHRPGRLRENNGAENSHLPFANGSERCSSSSPSLPSDVSSPPTQASTTPSTSNDHLIGRRHPAQGYRRRF